MKNCLIFFFSLLFGFSLQVKSNTTQTKIIYQSTSNYPLNTRNVSWQNTVKATNPSFGNDLKNDKTLILNLNQISILEFLKSDIQNQITFKILQNNKVIDSLTSLEFYKLCVESIRKTNIKKQKESINVILNKFYKQASTFEDSISLAYKLDTNEEFALSAKTHTRDLKNYYKTLEITQNDQTKIKSAKKHTLKLIRRSFKNFNDIDFEKTGKRNKKWKGNFHVELIDSIPDTLNKVNFQFQTFFENEMVASFGIDSFHCKKLEHLPLEDVSICNTLEWGIFNPKIFNVIDINCNTITGIPCFKIPEQLMLLENKQIEVRFDKNSSELTNQYKKIKETFLNSSSWNVKSLTISGFSSVEGSKSKNETLFFERADKLIQLFNQNNKDTTFEVSTSFKENWDQFYKDIRFSKYNYLLGKSVKS